MICSTLSGMMAIKHPTLGVLVREDGMVLTGGKRKAYEWTNGSPDGHGYRVVYILGKTYKVHRLVAEAFIQNLDGKPTVDHINRVRDDNRVCNLRWATHKEQRENSTTVLNRADYGVRWCENPIKYLHSYNKAHKDYIHDQQREYRKAHKEDISTKQREYRKAHKEDISTKQREYRKANIEYIRARDREYYKSHKEEKLEYARKYREKKKQDKLSANDFALMEDKP